MSRYAGSQSTQELPKRVAPQRQLAYTNENLKSLLHSEMKLERIPEPAENSGSIAKAVQGSGA